MYHKNYFIIRFKTQLQTVLKFLPFIANIYNAIDSIKTRINLV